MIKKRIIVLARTKGRLTVSAWFVPVATLTINEYENIRLSF